MKKVLEKVKDILYDSVDYIVIIAIVIGVVFIINWRLDGLFAETNIKTIPDASEVAKEDTGKDNESINSEEVEDEKLEDDEVKNEDSKPSVIIEVYIPAGSASSSIADALLSKDLIEDKAEFLNKLTELNLETKLRHGMYRIPKGSSLEEILTILTK